MRNRIALALRHPELGLFGQTGYQENVYWRDRGRELLPFHIVSMVQASEVRFVHIDSSMLYGCKPIDAKPMFSTELSIHEDMGPFDNIFAPVLVRTQEIIVDPARVGEHLEAIRRAQLPEQDAIRARNRSREREETSQRQVFHAQILSLAA